MPHAVRIALLCASLLLAAALGLLLHAWLGQPLRIEWLFARVQVEELRADPERLGQQGGALAWFERASRRLTEISPEARSEGFARARRQLAVLDHYDCDALVGEVRSSCRLLGYVLRMRVEGERWRHYDHPLNPLFGLQNTLPAWLAGQHPIATPKDAEDYVARLDAVAPKIEGLLAELRERQAAGIHPPRFLVAAVLADLRAFIAVAPAQNPLVTGFVERLQVLPDARLPQALRASFEREAQAAIERSVYPAWRQLIAHYEALRPLAREDHGVWALPAGEAYYAYSVRLHTTSGVSPLQAHRIGLDAVGRLEAEIEPRLQALGLYEGSIGERFVQLAQRPANAFAAGEEGRAQALALARAMAGEATRASAPAFSRLPRARLRIEPVPALRERGAPGAYYSPPAASGADGVVYLNLRAVEELPRHALRTLIHHEAVPGHHLQGALAAEATGLPAFRRSMGFSAYAEGWAMYAEGLAGELGLLPTPEDELGRLQAELFRAARLVVDTGLHQLRWTPAHAEQYLRQRVGLGEVEARAEVERYLVYPGQALAFQIGLTRFRALRGGAEARLGPRFRLPDFHDALLDGGRLPLDLLEQRVEAWIEARLADAE